MIGPTWNALFITSAMAVGMFAQQAAHKVSAGSEDKQVGSLSGLESFCSAEGYYLTGRFQGAAVITEPPAAVASLAVADESPALAATEGLPEAPPEPREPEVKPGIESPQWAVSQPWAESSEAETTIETTVETAMVVGSPSEGEDVGQPLPEAAAPALAGGETTEVLPPPAPDLPPRIPDDHFEKLADEPPPAETLRPTVRPPLPSRIAAPAGPTYHDGTSSSDSRYVSSADLVRERAMARGEQLRQRVEIRKWLGISPLRPVVESTPYTTGDEQQLILIVPSTASRQQH